MRRSISDGVRHRTAGLPCPYAVPEPCETLVTQRAMSYQADMTMKFCRQALALATIFIAMPARAEDDLPRPEPDTIIFAMMSGKCSTLNVAGRDFACRAVAFFQTEEGRANFTVALDDPH